MFDGREAAWYPKQMSSFIRKEIQNLKAYRLASHLEALKLNQNEMPYDLPGEIKAKVLEKLVRIPWNRYPLSQPFTFLSKLAQSLAWPAEGLVAANGSNVLIQALLLLSAVKSRVLTLDPTFSLYEIEAKVLGNEVELISLGENYSFPTHDLLKAMEKNPPSLLFIANPNAPTGNLFPKEEILKIVKAAPCLVVVDEAYFQFAEENLLSELSQHSNLVLLRTFSKALGLGGVRMGYALASPDIAQEISKVLLPYCVSGVNEIIAQTVLEHPEISQQRVTEIKINRAQLFQAMLHVKGVKVYPSQANFLIFQVNDAPKIFEALLKEGVLVRDVSQAPSLLNTLRVTVSKQEENEKFLRALEKVMKQFS